ncbi:ammonium transporter [Martelella alba]|uniref:Ammonium transporter n=1 Tax=Martelella alba TaxID=2590451 RepID=A0A506UGK6_9HYPH|nr:ammonium transporter [Martelella alba]TPW32444.1 ammonium transporter [Martelella alba]
MYSKLKLVAGASVIAAGSFALPAFAQDTTVIDLSTAAGVPGEVAWILNTLLFLVMGFLVMWMAAGFAMLEMGLVRTKNASMQGLKNVAIYAVGGLMFWFTGYSLMYTNVDGGFIGTFGPYMIPTPDAEAASAMADGSSYSVASDWFFQMVFCATAASVVSGTLAERIKLWPFMIFTVILTGFMYPITGSWQWGGGWLSEMGFSDFAGSTLVHSVGGWAALAGAFVLGPRLGKFSSDGTVNPMPGSNIPLAVLGTFILWLGWFGFNGGSQLALGSIADASAVSKIFVNTNLAAAAGAVIVMILLQIIYKKVDVTMVLNGALAGLVAITAEPLTPSVPAALFIGAIGGVIVVVVVPLLDKLKIDDVVGAIPVHLCAGIWGTFIVPLTNPDTSYVTQIIGIVSIGIFTFVVSLVVWLILKAVMGIRVSPEEETAGLDKAEIGVEAYPEFK